MADDDATEGKGDSEDPWWGETMIDRNNLLHLRRRSLYVLLLYRIVLVPPLRRRTPSVCVHVQTGVHVQRRHFAVHSPFGRVYRHRSFPGSVERASFLLPAGRDTLIPIGSRAKWQPSRKSHGFSIGSDLSLQDRPMFGYDSGMIRAIARAY